MKTLKIIKIGGNIIDDADELNYFLKGFSKLKGLKILVHGGGKSATALANKLGVDAKMIDGRRITDTETLDIVTMTYAGKINKTIVAQLQANDCNALGLSGADGNTILAEKRPVKNIDYGFAGDVVKVNTGVLKLLITNNIILVFCALTHNGNGQLLNTNADTIAAELAIAFAKDYYVELYYCFEKNGLLKDVTDNDSVIPFIDTKTYNSLIADGVITDGMLPKLNNCFYALKHQVSKVCIGKAEMLFNSNSKFTTIQE
ncbi:acetylglutamate kinase [Xanthomarina gelatinilytica]|uniref:acetylglutamate kinase n=1 Tax=Xanthomarina gelatinilytica TaxID=1137281 RepID=UPI003AA8D9EE